jgi:APA family basic amino acid/polyamine antiporter
MFLTRTLGFRDLVLMIVGTVIGSGIFLVPGPVLKDVQGHTGIAMLAWLAGGVLSLMGALTYGELSALWPKSGGLYVYIRDCFGSSTAFLYGWTLFFLISSGSIATLAVGFAIYFSRLIPLGPVGVKLLAIGMIAVVAVVNVVGTRKGANVLNLATAIKVSVLLVLSVSLLALGHHSHDSPTGAVVQTGSLVTGFGVAMISVLWAYEGWQYCTFTAGETINPQRNFPRAFLFGTVGLIALYLLANAGYLAALGPTRAADSHSIAAVAAEAVIGPAASKLITIAILISTFSAANGMMLTSPRVYFTMAQDGVFFQKLARVHARYKTPAVAILCGAAWSMVLAATGTFEQLLTYVVFSGWIFYALGAMAVFSYRRKYPDMARPYRVPGYPWTPLFFIITAAWLVVNTIAADPRHAAIGLALVLSGVPAYLIWRRKQRRSEDEAAKQLEQDSFRLEMKP